MDELTAANRRRISTPRGYCWTLGAVGKSERERGFRHEDQFIRRRDYVNGAGGIADKMRACD